MARSDDAERAGRYIRPGDHRQHDLLGRLVPHNPFGNAVSLLRAIPGLGARFDRDVPASHLQGDGIRCTCGQGVERLEQNEIVACPGGCGRWFLRVDAQRVKCALLSSEAVPA